MYMWVYFINNKWFISKLKIKSWICFDEYLAFLFVFLACLRGYIGENCEIECSFPYYGLKCLQECTCNISDFHYVDGCILQSEKNNNSNIVTITERYIHMFKRKLKSLIMEMLFRCCMFTFVGFFLLFFVLQYGCINLFRELHFFLIWKKKYIPFLSIKKSKTWILLIKQSLKNINKKTKDKKFDLLLAHARIIFSFF